MAGRLSPPGTRSNVVKALLLAIGQLDDPACVGVLVRSVLLSLLAYALLLAAGIWGTHSLLAMAHWPGWLAALLGTIGVLLLAFWLFLPTVMVIATLYMERIALAVDARHYPYLPSPTPAALTAQIWDGLALGIQVLVLNAVALLLALLIPGIGLVLAIVVSGWAIGRGLFVAVAMRRMGRGQAQALYRSRRFSVLIPGMLLAIAATIPGLNLLVPVVGTAAMVHVLNRN